MTQMKKQARPAASRPRPVRTVNGGAVAEKLSQAQRMEPIVAGSISLNITLGMTTIISVIAVLVMAAYMVTRPQDIRYVIQAPDGRVIVSEEPIRNSEAVTYRADQCVRKIFNIDFVHHKRQLAQASDCFTNEAFEQVLADLQNQSYVQLLTEAVRVGELIPARAPTVTRSKPDRWGKQRMKVEGEYVWSLYDGVVNDRTNVTSVKLDVEVVMVEVPDDESPYGMQIQRIDVNPLSGV